MKRAQITYQYSLSSKDLVEQLPQGPGVYLFKDNLGAVLYVGKAKNLRKRLMSYLRPSGGLPQKTLLMMRRARGLDLILTGSEKEALILESTLIKRYLPRYNIVLRDDSQYPCLRLSIDEPYPRLSIVRRIKRDGARYFGPFSSAKAVRDTLRVIDRVFQLRKCKGSEVKPRQRPCLNYQMNRCLGPCCGKISEVEYRQIVEQVIMFLEGRNKELLETMNRDMVEAAEALEFERAARIRDQISAVKKTIERQHVVSTRLADQDVIGLASKEGFFVVVVMSVRNGYLVSSRDYTFRAKDETDAEVMEAFLKQYYFAQEFVPREVLVSQEVADGAAIEEWLSEVAGARVDLRRPKRGEKKRLVEMAVSNAENVLKLKEARGESDILERLQFTLGLKNLPRHIEAIDISTLQGGFAVGTIVSFVDGKPEKAGYRNYKIRTVKGVDDYAMMGEVLARRVEQGGLPDLFVIDGGKGQLGIVEGVLDSYDLEDQSDLVALAKAEYKKGETSDKIYVRGSNRPIVLPYHDPVLLFLMKIRDETHRRAVTHHRKLRRKGLTQTILREIPGIGEKRARSLLRHFPSLEHIKEATAEELAQLPGMTMTVALQIRKYFQP